MSMILPLIRYFSFPMFLTILLCLYSNCILNCFVGSSLWGSVLFNYMFDIFPTIIDIQLLVKLVSECVPAKERGWCMNVKYVLRKLRVLEKAGHFLFTIHSHIRILENSQFFFKILEVEVMLPYLFCHILFLIPISS